jgi:hypothetical protein
MGIGRLNRKEFVFHLCESVAKELI